jgi:hypothetical protein
MLPYPSYFIYRVRCLYSLPIAAATVIADINFFLIYLSILLILLNNNNNNNK